MGRHAPLTNKASLFPKEVNCQVRESWALRSFQQTTNLPSFFSKEKEVKGVSENLLV